MTRPQIGVLALQGNVREHARALSAVGADPVPVRRASELDAVDALIIPGGESTTIDHLLRAFDLREPLRARLAGGMPAYGSCAGMILLADVIADPAATRNGEPQQSLGGIAMTVRRNAFGRQIDSFEAPLDWRGPGSEDGPFPGVFIRAPWVESVEPKVEVLATVPFSGEERIVAVRQGSQMATAFHPELTDDLRVHQLLMDLIR